METLPATTTTNATGPMALAERTQHINISGDIVTTETAGLPDAHRDAVRWLYAFAKDQEWDWDDLNKNTGISTTTWYRIWNGKYLNPTTHEPINLDSIVAKILKLRPTLEARYCSTRLPFIETSVWKRFDKLCREVRADQTIGFVYGESQIGKSACGREFARRNNHGLTPFVLTPAAAGVQAMMKSIAEELHISSRTCFEQLRSRVIAALDPTKLLIMDEIHEVFISYQKTSLVKCMSVLRQIQEISGCGMVLIGTNAFRSELERGEFSQSLKQLRRRGIFELQLEDQPTDEDIALICEHYKLGAPTGKIAEEVQFILAQMGLGKFIKFLARASRSAAEKRQQFTWKHFDNILSIAETLRTKPKAKNHTIATN